MISAVRSAFSFNRVLHLSCSDLSPESAPSCAVPIRDVYEVVCGGRRGGGEDAARGNEANQEVSAVSLEKLEFKTISA
jgi:hypothetical protein